MPNPAKVTCQEHVDRTAQVGPAPIRATEDHDTPQVFVASVDELVYDERAQASGVAPVLVQLFEPRPPVRWLASTRHPNPQPVPTPAYTDEHFPEATLTFVAWHEAQAEWTVEDHSWHARVGREKQGVAPPWPPHLPWWAALPPPVYPAVAEIVVNGLQNYRSPANELGEVKGRHLDLVLGPIWAAWSASPYRGNNSTMVGSRSEGRVNLSASGLGPTYRQLRAALQRLHLPAARGQMRRYLQVQAKDHLMVARRWAQVLRACQGSTMLAAQACCMAAVQNVELTQVHPDGEDVHDLQEDDGWDAMSSASGLTTFSELSAGGGSVSGAPPMPVVSEEPTASAAAPRLEPAAALRETLAWLKDNDPDEYRVLLREMMAGKGGGQ